MSPSDSKISLLWKRFYLWAFGVFFVYCAYGSLLSLQSSINVEEGLGTATVACICISGSTLSLFITPAIIRRFGVKKCVWCAEIGHFMFTILNLYARWYTVIPASVFVGLGDVMLWTCMPIMNTYFAEIYAILHKQPSRDAFKSMFQSYFFGVFQMAKIAGNLISYGILYGFREDSSANVRNDTFNSSLYLEFCGSRDCQDEAILEKMINQYVPANEWSIRVLIICLAALCITAIVIHVLFIPDDLRIFGIDLDSKNPVTEKEQISNNDAVESQLVETKVDTSTRNHNKTNERYHMLGLVVKRSRKQDEVCSFGLAATKATLKQLVRFDQLLLNPMHLYTGIAYAFGASEATRSYTSCVFGVTWVPIHSLFFGAFASLTSYVAGRLSKKIKRPFFIIIAVAVDTANLLYCLLWTPNDSNHISVMVIFMMVGISQGLWIPFSQVLQVTISPGRVEVGASVNIFLFIIGIGFEFAWSAALCMYAKIYLQFGVLAITVIGYCILECKIRRGRSGEMAKTG